MTDSNSSNSERTIIEGFIHYSSIVWKYRIMVGAVIGVITLATLVFCIVSVILPPEKSPLPNSYTAEAVILVQDSGQSDIADTILNAMGIEQNTRAARGRDNGELVMEVLRSRWLLDSIVDEFKIIDMYGITKNVKGASRAIILDKADFQYSIKTGALRIAYSDINPVFAKNVVNKMVNLLEVWFNQNRGIAKQKQRESLEAKVSEVKTSIETLQNQLKALQRRYGVLNVQELGETQAASIANLRAQLILKDVEIKNYTSFSKIDDPRLEQLKEERQNLLDLIAQNQKELPEASSYTGGYSGGQSLADVAQQFTKLTQELDIQQKIYNTLSPQLEAARLAPESDPIFQVLELADVPDMKSGPKRAQLIVMAFGLSLVAGIAIALAWNTIKNFYTSRRAKHGGPA